MTGYGWGGVPSTSQGIGYHAYGAVSLFSPVYTSIGVIAQGWVKMYQNQITQKFYFRSGTRSDRTAVAQKRQARNHFNKDRTPTYLCNNSHTHGTAVYSRRNASIDQNQLECQKHFFQVLACHWASSGTIWCVGCTINTTIYCPVLVWTLFKLCASLLLRNWYSVCRVLSSHSKDISTDCSQRCPHIRRSSWFFILWWPWDNFGKIYSVADSCEPEKTKQTRRKRIEAKKMKGQRAGNKKYI